MSTRPVAVCIPARNEAERLPALVASLAAQQRGAGTALLRVVVVANNCTDATVPLLRALKHDLRAGAVVMDVLDVHLEPAEAHVGFARRLALDRGAAWLEGEGRPDGVLMTTDADAIAPPGWVAANLAALDHAELVGGRLRMARDDRIDPCLDDLHARIERYWTGVRALEQAIDPPPYDPDPRHGDHTGASLALSLALYRQVGGLPTLACGEDNALVTRVRCAGGRVRHCPQVEVIVSPRRDGRVEGGMASEMRRRAVIAANRTRYDLPSGEHWKRLFERRAELRQAWAMVPAGGTDRLFALLGFDDEDRAAISPTTCPNDIAFVERAMLRDGDGRRAVEHVALDTAIEDIDHILDTLRVARRAWA